QQAQLPLGKRPSPAALAAAMTTGDIVKAPEAGKSLKFRCPHCNDEATASEINCGVFRHANFKDGSLVPPHTSKPDMDTLRRFGQIIGCGNPFEIRKSGPDFLILKCDKYE